MTLVMDTWMRLLGASLVLLLLPLGIGAAPSAQGQERLWVLDLAVEGPLEEIAISAGDDGRTRLRLGLLAGERRTLAVPVPVRSPLGASALARVPLPTVESMPSESEVSRSAGAGAAIVLGWREPQAAAAYELLPPGIRARSTPPVANALRHASLGGLLLLATAFVGVLILRERRLLALLWGGLVSGVLLLVVAREGGGRTETVVVEADLTRAVWLEVRAARNELRGPFDSLRVEPDGALELELGAEGPMESSRLVARAPGAVLVGRRRLGGPGRDLAARRNQLGDFTVSFLRAPGGEWTAHGAWRVGDALPEALGLPSAAGVDPSRGLRGSPPGWLAAGLPPGEWALLGRLADGRWVRATGFRAERESVESR